jgi:hypothetical protein
VRRNDIQENTMKKALQVTLDVREPSTVELTTDDKVQLDRLSASQRGYLGERHGSLLGPGVVKLSLEPGFYFFRTLSDANLKVVRGGVTVHANGTGSKDPPPPPPLEPTQLTRGDEPSGETPRLTIS